MGSANYFASGQWNFICDLCGRKGKSGDAVKTWDNHYVCRKHKEVRNPQDFVRGVKDVQSVPWVRKVTTDTFVSSSYPILDTFGNLLTDTSGSPILDR